MRRKMGDRRIRPRFDIVGDLWGTLETVLRLPLRNVSRGGALIHSHVPLPSQSVHRLAFHSNGQDLVGTCSGLSRRYAGVGRRRADVSHRRPVSLGAAGVARVDRPIDGDGSRRGCGGLADVEWLYDGTSTIAARGAPERHRVPRGSSHACATARHQPERGLTGG